MIRLSQIAAPAVVGAALLFGVGCAHEDRPDEINANATMIGEGHNTVSANAPHDGTLTVWDDTAHKMVYTSRVEKGDTVKVDAKHNRVILNDKVAEQRDLINDHNYKIYFDRSNNADSDLARHRKRRASRATTARR